MFVEPQHQPITTKPADPFSLPALIAWLETMPAAKPYDFNCYGECMLAQWLISIDPKSRSAGTFDGYEYIVHGEKVKLRQYRHIAYGDIRGDDSRTFGAALTRARKALSDQQPRALADTSRETV